MKSVYSKSIYKLIIYLGILVLLVIKHFISLDDTVINIALGIYDLVLIAFAVVLIINKDNIEKNEDEMVKYINSKVHSIILTVSQIFLLILLCLLISPYKFIQSIPIDRKTVSLLLSSFLFAMSLLRILLFKHYDGKEF